MTTNVSYDETFSFLITGGSGSGYLKITAYFIGVEQSLVTDQFGTTASYLLSSPNGSFGAQSFGGMQTFFGCSNSGPFCTIPFVFDVPFDVRFQFSASANYLYCCIAQSFGAPPLIFGRLWSESGVANISVLDSNYVRLESAQITISPEPSTAVMIGLAALAYVVRRRSRG